MGSLKYLSTECWKVNATKAAVLGASASTLGGCLDFGSTLETYSTKNVLVRRQVLFLAKKRKKIEVFTISLSSGKDHNINHNFFLRPMHNLKSQFDCNADYMIIILITL